MGAAGPLNTVIIGAAGRMGRALIRAVAEIPNELRLCGAVVSTTSTSIGQDAGELAGIGRIDVRITDDLAAALARAEIVIDFSQPHATRSNLMVCRAARKPLLIGTTGFPPELASVFDEAAKEIPLLVAPNTSVGVTLLLELTRIAAKALPSDFDIEIVEAHHRMKKDAPSGTALALGKAAVEGRSIPTTTITDRTGERRSGDIGYAVIRGGDIVGDHTVLFAGTGEQITLGHRATDRAIFARGAVRAALWLAAQPAGHYFMRDFIGLKTST
jgi:4-hydroxy-tetrahydrodipicolinate reductase